MVGTTHWNVVASIRAEFAIWTTNGKMLVSMLFQKKSLKTITKRRHFFLQKCKSKDDHKIELKYYKNAIVLFVMQN